MATIQFGGLASGLDTASIVTAIMDAERTPVVTKEEEIDYLEAQNESFDAFSDLLAAVNSAVGMLDSSSDFNAYQATTNRDDALQVTTSSYTKPGSYQVEVLSLAQQQKDVSSEGFASSDEATLSGSLQIGVCEISYTDISLSDLVEQINGADAGVTAGLVDDGTENGLRLVLTADDASLTPDIVASGSITIDSVANGHTFEGSMAHIKVDGLDIYSETNTVTQAVYGVTLNLVGVDAVGETTYLQVASDTSTISENVDAFVSAYNDLLTYIDDAWEADPSLGNEFRQLERSLQGLLTTTVDLGSGYNSLAALGFETDPKTGLLSHDASVLNDALAQDPAAVEAVFVGTADQPGAFAQLGRYLSEQVSPTIGFAASKTASNDTQINALQQEIERMELRLEKREETLYAQYNALELTMAELNSQADYLESFFAQDSGN